MLKFFKSREEREQEKRTEAAKQARAYDTGAAAGERLFKAVDGYFSEYVIGAALSGRDFLRQEMENARKAGDERVVVFLWETYQRTIAEDFVPSILPKVLKNIGEHKYVAIELGAMELIEKHVAEETEKLVEAMLKGAGNEVDYNLARIRGLITDEMHEMSPEELRAYMKQKHG